MKYHLKRNGFTLVAFVFLWCFFLHAQWHKENGPSFITSYQIYSLAADSKGNLFASSSNGLHRSTDNGEHWIKVSEVYQNPLLPAISFVFSKDGEMFINGGPYKVSRSTNLGETWLKADSGIQENSAISFLLSTASGALLAAFNQSPFDGRLYRSSNHGATWSVITTKLFGQLKLAVDSAGVILAANGQSLIRSFDDGLSWTDPDTVIIDGPISSLAISPAGEVFIATTFNNLYRSTNGGTIWEKLSSLPGYYVPIKITFGKANNVFIISESSCNECTIISRGLSRSSDGGYTWSLVEKPQWVGTIIVDSKKDLFVGTAFPINTTNFGIVVPEGELNSSDLEDVMNPFAELGVFHSTDQGGTWVAVNTGLEYLEFPKINTLFLTSNGNVLASTLLGDTPMSLGIYSRTSNESTWSLLTDSLSVVNAFAEGSNGSILAAGNGFFWSTDQGKTWNINNGSPGSITSIISHPNGSIIAANGSIIRSTNGGQTWSKSVSGIPAPINDGFINTIKLLPNGDIVAGGIGVFRSTNAGITWSSLDTIMKVSAFEVHPNGNLFASSINGIYRSLDGGEHWNKVSDLPTQSIVIDQIGFIFVGTPSYYFYSPKIYRSTDIGSTWTDISEGLPSIESTCLAISPDNQLLLGTSEGVYRYNPPTEVNHVNSQLPAAFSISQNYPNPFNPSTVISYQLPITSHVSLKIFDLLGREVATLVNEEKRAGSYEVTFNAQNLSSGVYFYQLRSGEFVQTKKLIFQK
jgi:photosystem II stability/assembly factor-like uncharacterized protein